ncbi:MAG: single-stranded-DNA-specific exonuclease RecJ [Hormoscilla sp. GM102CHS1]|nr:single-stranded-DNA-specific exonuclease RecJ [Hormoscilla sp. GM102CHS1]
MSDRNKNIPWLISSSNPPDWFVQAVQGHAPNLPKVDLAAQLLWSRGIQDLEKLAGFLDPNLYQPASPWEFGAEMDWAVKRLQQARVAGEMVTIWGDFDADGVTSTAVLWDGLGQFLDREKLSYYIPDRLTESHGLNCQGIDAIAQEGTKLIVTCDTGSTNLAEIEYTRQMGIYLIITDHHVLLAERPPVTAIINPRYLPAEHPLFHLSGVAVAYKLIEALYQAMPDVPQQPLEDLLDLVAIGLISDLVQLSGDCRYLAQVGIKQLQADFQKTPESRRRPGVGRMLELCQRNGDRPTDISFGLGPRINAVSRIHGDASFCVELLTSRDINRCLELAEAAELANTRRKALQKDVAADVAEKLSQLDLSTTEIIVLDDPQWHVGVLGLVAAEVAQTCDRPTILLSTEVNENQSLARGSARSVAGIDLYQLVKSQAQLLDRFGGHPFAAGLSLPVENIPLFTEAINQQLRSTDSAVKATPAWQADLVVAVAELGKDLFRQLKLLEPCGIGNRVPKLLIENCWFANAWNKNIKDFQGKKVRYIKTEVIIGDDSIDRGFNGVWWGHYKEEIPPGRCDAIVELDYNPYHKRYEVRLMAVRPCTESEIKIPQMSILDWRGGKDNISQENQSLIILTECPACWDDLQQSWREASGGGQERQQPVAIAYPEPQAIAPQEVWQKLLGIAKYLSRTGKTANRQQLQAKLGLGETAVNLGLQALEYLGFTIITLDTAAPASLQIAWHPVSEAIKSSVALKNFLAAVEEEQFRRQYFCQVSISTIQSQLVNGER